MLVSSDEPQLCERPSRGGTAPVAWLRGMFPCFDHLPSFSRFEAAFLWVLCFDIAPSLRDEVTLPGRVLSQSSIRTKALPPPSWCFRRSLRDEVILTGRVFLRPRSERRLFANLPKGLVPSLHDGVTRIGSCCVFLRIRSERRLIPSIYP